MFNPVHDPPDFVANNRETLDRIAEVAGREDILRSWTQRYDTRGVWRFEPWVGGMPGVELVCHSLTEAEENLRTLLAWCRARPDVVREMATPDTEPEPEPEEQQHA